MGNITYEQFVTWCKHWNYTIEEGFKAMCFSANIIGQYFGNCHEYAKEVSNDNNHSDAFKHIVKTNKENAILLSSLYSRLESEVFNMLENTNGV